MPKVSVIIPVYNAAQYMAQCIESVITQTLQDIEVIIINDGSTDNSLDIITKYQEKDARIIVINQNNQGVSIARNNGIEVATGEYIGFVDADDYIKVNYLEELYNLINNKNGDMSLCGFYGSSQRFLTHKEIILNKKDEGKIIELFKSYLIFAPYNKLYKAHVIKENNITYNNKTSYGEDLLFNLEYLNLISKINITPKVLYIYNVNAPNSLAKQMPIKRYKDIEFEISQIEKYFNKLDLITKKSKLYLEDLYYQNLYNSIYVLYNSFHDKSRKEIFLWIKEIFNFQYIKPNYEILSNRNKPILIRIFFLNNKWLIYSFIYFHRLIKIKP